MTNLAPEHPKGCPIAIAPPCILTLFSGIFNFFIQYIACPANASFISNKSISSIFNPSFFINKGIATDGPIPIISGGTPTDTYPVILPNILSFFILYFFIIDFDTNKHKAAPSDKGLELPAVTEPFLTKHGFNFDKDSNDIFSLMQSSLS